MTEPRPCAVGPCSRPRFADTSFCERHGTNSKSPWSGGTLDADDGKALLKRGYSQRIACPHCQVVGKVEVNRTKIKKGISGGKATGALLTGGWTLLATGLARKEMASLAKCNNCGVSWAL